MKFNVTINYRKGPAFSTEVNAESKADAEVQAALAARENGFDGIPKKIVVKAA